MEKGVLCQVTLLQNILKTFVLGMRYQGLRLNKPRQSLPVLQTTGTVSPFYIPPDQQIFGCKQLMNKTKKDLFYRRNQLKIWERDISKQGLSIKDLNRIGQTPASTSSSITLNYPVNLMRATKLSMQNNVHRSQSVKTFLNRKKQILRYQIKINNKRQEITKLQESVKQHQNGLKNCQNFMQEDINNFNAYLNINKLQVRKVIKDSEEQAKNKNDRIRVLKEKLEIKTDLTGKINSKIQVLENLIKYKRFLDDFHSIAKTGKHKQKSGSNVSQQQAASHSAKISQEYACYLKRNFSISNELQKYLENSNQNQTLRFSTPSQLLGMFLNLEQANLSCITNLNSIEERMETVKFNYNQKKIKMSNKKSQLIITKMELMRQLTTIDKQIDRFKFIACKEKKQLQSGIENQIYQIYKDYQNRQIPSELKAMPLQILKDIEKKLQSLSKGLNEARQEKLQFVQSLEKNCFMEKREKKKIKISEKEEYLMKMEELEAEKKKDTKEKKKRRKVMKKNVINREAKQVKYVDHETDEEQLDIKKYLM